MTNANTKGSHTNSLAAVYCTDLLECIIITIEHGWICIRNRAGWLLWSAKESEVDLRSGIVMGDIAPELSKRQAEWQRDYDEAQSDHSNTKLSGGGPLINKMTEAESRRPLE